LGGAAKANTTINPNSTGIHFFIMIQTSTAVVVRNPALKNSSAKNAKRTGSLAQLGMGSAPECTWSAP
jgi:hypothetical protein